MALRQEIFRITKQDPNIGSFLWHAVSSVIPERGIPGAEYFPRMDLDPLRNSKHGLMQTCSVNEIIMSLYQMNHRTLVSHTLTSTKSSSAVLVVHL